MSPRPGTVNRTPAAEISDDAAYWQEAARLRREHRAWVVIWLARESCYRAYRNHPWATPPQVTAVIMRALAAITVTQRAQPPPPLAPPRARARPHGR